ncbi:MAG: membrane protein insertion efficiency factor YidD [Sphingopyxis sp.]|nr:membrane protein insertion efficiency factor YidD [Sphingopyxis sp.]
MDKLEEQFDRVYGLLRTERTQTLVMLGKPSRVAKYLDRVYRGLHAKAVRGIDSTDAPPDARNRISSGAIDLQRELRESLAQTLRLPTTAIAPDQSFGDFGLDSFTGQEWVAAINRRYGTALANIALYDYPNVNALAAHLRTQLKVSAPGPVVAVPHAARETLAPLPRLRPIAGRQTPYAAECGRRMTAAPVGPIGRIIRAIAKAPVVVYRWTLKPLLGNECRHLPTCSEYALEAIDRNGAWKGFWLMLAVAAAGAR